MKCQTKINHVALLVPSAVQAASVLSTKGLFANPAEIFESEGTREIYIGKSGQMGRILLLEPISEGPYRNSVLKRGYGLHHIAIDVDELDAYIAETASSGWQLHVKSPQIGQWLYKPGIPFLVELGQLRGHKDLEPLITSLEISDDEIELKMQGLQISEIHASSKKDLQLIWQTGNVGFKELLPP